MILYLFNRNIVVFLEPAELTISYRLHPDNLIVRDANQAHDFFQNYRSAKATKMGGTCSFWAKNNSLNVGTTSRIF